jgi:hypothetical protein
MCYHYQWYSSQICDRVVLGDCNAENMMLQLAIIWEYIEMLSCYKLCQYDIDDVLHCENCISIDDMKTVVSYLNQVFNVNYCVDFIDSTNTYIPAGSCSCGFGLYTTTIDPIRDDLLWIDGDVTSVLNKQYIVLMSCDGLTIYLNIALPDAFALDISGNTWIQLNVNDVPNSWDRTVVYCIYFITP